MIAIFGFVIIILSGIPDLPHRFMLFQLFVGAWIMGLDAGMVIARRRRKR